MVDKSLPALRPSGNSSDNTINEYFHVSSIIFMAFKTNRFLPYTLIILFETVPLPFEIINQIKSYAWLYSLFQLIRARLSNFILISQRILCLHRNDK